MAGMPKSQSRGHVGSTFGGSFNGAKSRAGMSFTSSNTPNAAFSQNLNASFGSTCFSRTAKLKKLEQAFTSLGKDCQVKFSVFNEHQETMGKQLGAIHQDVQATGNQMGTMNQGMEDLSNHHDTLHKQCETEFERVYNDFGNMTKAFENVNKEFDDVSTHVQAMRDNQFSLTRDQEVLKHKITMKFNLHVQMIEQTGLTHSYKMDYLANSISKDKELQELQSKEIEVIHAGRRFEGDAPMDSQDSKDNEVAIITMNRNDEGIKHIIVDNVDFCTKNQDAVDTCLPNMDIIIAISDTMNTVGNAMLKH
jgi:hypothetical protein